MRRTTMPMPMWPTLPMLDLVDMLARDYEALDPSDARFAGLVHALRVLSQLYAEHPDYHEEWRP
ncbi:DUF6221 family protein [Streptomyces sp. NPDC002215]|uniref:DUF6221 family protein n=1 Tax=Streptomyces sp. NPDC002215 TaxID=3154412 RepID=UPI00331C7FBB